MFFHFWVEVVLSASPDFSILATNVETGQAVARLNNAHRLFSNSSISYLLQKEKNFHVYIWLKENQEIFDIYWWMSWRCPINRLINLSENTIASGDDDGTIKVIYSYKLLYNAVRKMLTVQVCRFGILARTVVATLLVLMRITYLTWSLLPAALKS